MRTFWIAVAAIVLLLGCDAETGLGPDALLDSTIEVEIGDEWWPLASVATESLDDDTPVRITSFEGVGRIDKTTWGDIKCRYNPDCNG